MQITAHTDYALRLLIYLHAHGSESPVGVAEVAAAYDISANHLAKIAQTLRSAGWVNTQRGRGGGLTLSASVYNVTLGDIFRQMEGDCGLVECFRKSNTCAIDSCCGLKHILQKAHASFIEVLDEYRLSDLVKKPDKMRIILSINSA